MTGAHYSSPGSPAAVDAGQITVAAWPKDQTVAVQFKTAATLRALAVALQANNQVLDLIRIGRHPLKPAGLDAADRLLRLPGVAAALTQTLALSDAENLRDALTDAIEELQTKPGDDWVDQR